jgi:anti-sigma B factor antagonist
MSHGHSESGSGAASDRPVRDDAESELSLRRVVTDRCPVIEAYGEIDVASAGELREMIDSSLGPGAQRLIVDLSGIRFMDSSGLNALIGTARRLGAGSFGVVVSRPGIRRIFAVTGIDNMVPVFDSVAEAAQALETGPAAEDSLLSGGESVLDPN